MKKGVAIRTASAVLAAVLLLCPLSVCFADDDGFELDPSIVAASELEKQIINYYIWIYLSSIGIDVAYGDVEAFTGELNDWFEEQLLAWLDTVPGIGTIDQLIFPWKFFWNPDGYLIGNQSFLDDISDFTEWLIDAFDLEDDSSQQVQSLETELGEVVVYSLPFACNSIGNESRPTEFTWTLYTSDEPGYFAFQGTGTSCFLRFMAETQTQVTQTRFFNGNTYTSQTNLGEHHGVWYSNTSAVALDKVKYHLTGYQFYEQNTIISAMTNNNQVSYYGNNIYILTNTIDPPTASEADGTNSIVITPSGNIYTPQDWDGTVHVDNLPAIVSTGTVTNPGLSDVFLPLKGFINTFSDGFGLMTQIVYNLPSPVVGMALAIMSAIAVFGVIKVLKEH